MDARDREAIEGLFTRIEDIARQAGPRDAEAEQLIGERVQRLPAASYYLAQTVVMQDLALKTLQARVDELEKAAKAQPEAGEGGGFLSRGTGFGAPPAPRSAVPSVGTRGPWGQAEPQPGASSPAPAPYAPPPAYPQQQAAPPSPGFGSRLGGGGGFLAGAAQTAMGVAGGVVLGNALGSMLGGHGGLFGGAGPFGGGAAGATEVTENVTNVYEAPQDGVQEASDTTPADDAGGDGGYQDASYDEPGGDDGFAADDGGFDDI